MKKITLIISMLLVYAFGGYADTWDGSTISSWTKGSGTSSDPYLIESAANLAYFRDMVNSGVSYSGKYFKLTTNINFNGGTGSIGSASSCPFSGTFDGGNFSISNAVNNLFYYTENATIKNVTYSGTGALVYSLSGGSMDNCTKMTGTGGLVVEASSATINNCTNKSNAVGGGIVRSGGNITISNCINIGTCSESSCYYYTPKDATYNELERMKNGGYVEYAGGIIGRCTGKVTITNCGNKGNVTVSSTEEKRYPCGGGIVGVIGEGDKVVTVTQCYNKGVVSVSLDNFNNSNSSRADGFVGWNRSNKSVTIKYCYNNAEISVYSNRNNTNYVGVSSGENCYNVGLLTKNGSYTYSGYSMSGTNSYYISTTGTTSSSSQKTETYMKSSEFVTLLNNGSDVYQMDVNNENGGFPIFRKSYTITVKTNNSSMGTVSGGGSYKYEATATITATPKTGYQFVKWNDGNTSASRTVTVTGAATYTATFSVATYALTVTSANTTMGTVTGGGTYEYNSSVTIKATPKEHYHFVKWSDGNTNASRTVTVTKAATYTATFAIDTHVLTVSSANTTMGTVTVVARMIIIKQLQLLPHPKQAIIL